VIPTSTATPVTVRGTTQQWFEENNKKPWFWPITVLGGFLGTYTVGVSALLLWAWRGGSTIFSRTWLHTIAAKPLLITPGLGRWALFIGYGQRVLKLRAVEKASTDYFGLPATQPGGSVILPDARGDSLHERIAQALGPQQPVMLLGKGGAGKSTLLARWVYLALTGQLPATLKGFRPVLVPASYYEGSLVKAIAGALRERDGVAVDESVMQAQLQSGKYLILFDGVSEVEADKQGAINEILRTARNADFQNCRFLISTRPLEGIPAEISTFHLQPLTVNVVLDLLPRYGLGRERESQLRQQLQSFGDKPIEPLLFTMALEQSGSGQLSATRTQLYERYFRRLLHAESDEMLWSGWRTALEMLAQWFLLDTGRRGAGLPHEPLVDLVAGKRGDGAAAGNLLERLRRFYRLPAKDELDLLQHLQASGLLQGGRRWRFAHDTFEEYFAASCLVSRLDKDDQLPRLDKWIGIHEQEVEFCEVLDFVKEMTDAVTRRRIVRIGVPSLWQERLENDNADHPGPA